MASENIIDGNIIDFPSIDLIEFNEDDEMEYIVRSGIKIYEGTTHISRNIHTKNIEYLKSKLTNKIFTELEPSTLTAQGLLSNISFIEKDLIDLLPTPTGYIELIGCSFGEKLNPNYNIPIKIKKSGRGRKPIDKPPTTRKILGNGKYFSSQITFQIQHPDNPNTKYKIKLFRNGKFQVPGIKDPSMTDLIKPIKILQEYLINYFGIEKNIEIKYFIAVMRNYKCKLIDPNIHVDLELLRELIEEEKKYINIKPYISQLFNSMPESMFKEQFKFLGKTNIMNVAEVAYNNDRCFSLNIKFYRPMPNDPDKKTTIKLLKKGKINFDGGNSEIETIELYYYIQNIYNKYANQILVDVSKIQNTYNPEIYDLVNIYKDGFIYE
jgi:hypothetical protein